MSIPKPQAIIIHGAYGNPGENWFPWLKSKLEEKGWRVSVPKLPTPENQSLENWLKVLAQYELDEDTILVGHSLGPAFILTVLEGAKRRIKAAFLVAAFIGLLNNPEFDEINKPFTVKDFDWDKIKANCKKFLIYASDNDPYVPLEKARELKSRLNAELKIVKGAGHFNTSAGYTAFDLLLSDIASVAK